MRRLAAPGSVHAPQVSAPSAAAHARQAAPRPARTGRRRRAQVACLSAAPLAGDAPAAELLAVGTWDRCLHLLRLPGLAPATPKEALGGDVIPRRWAARATGGLVAGVPGRRRCSTQATVALGSFVALRTVSQFCISRPTVEAARMMPCGAERAAGRAAQRAAGGAGGRGLPAGRAGRRPAAQLPRGRRHRRAERAQEAGARHQAGRAARVPL